MFTFVQIELAKVLLKIFVRDRQSMFFSLLFPLMFMMVFGLMSGGDSDPFEIGIVNNATSEVAAEFVDSLSSNNLFSVSLGDEEELKAKLVEGEIAAILVLPDEFQETLDGARMEGVQIRVLVDAAQVRLLGLIMPVLEQALLSIERKFTNTKPMFNLTIEDVQARSQRYLDFLLPGILAFTLMQICIAGSGFNIVEYRRKGILKRLFVTPIEPKDFIAAIVMARLLLCLVQLSVLLAIAVLFLGVPIVGGYLSLYTVVVLGAVVFLCIGFFLGSLAKTQQAIGVIGNIVIFPQMFLSGIFFPIERMPEFVQPVASVLPLTFVVNGLREIATNGLTLMEIVPDLIGIAVWMVIGFLLATRYFVWKEVAS